MKLEKAATGLSMESSTLLDVIDLCQIFLTVCDCFIYPAKYNLSCVRLHKGSIANVCF